MEEVIKLAEKITTTGSHKLDENLIKSIKKACKKDDSLLLPLFETLMNQLKRKHSEIRLSSFQVMSEIFKRSHQFRTLVLDELETIFSLVLETNNVLLPPPKSAAKVLRTFSAETFKEWKETFGAAYKKLEHGYKYLKQVKRVCFNDIEGRSELERRREEERKLKMDNIWKERVKRVQAQMESHLVDIEDCLTQMKNCIELLVPNPENFLFAQDENEGDLLEEATDLKSHGILDVKAKITIDLPPNASSTVIEETDDNRDIFNTLREQYVIFESKLCPMVKKWSITLTKAGENCDSILLKKSIDIKNDFDKMEKKLEPFKTTLKVKRMITEDSDTDDDFIEVEEKPGYEATVQAEHHMLGIDFYSQPSTSSKPIGQYKDSEKISKKKINLDIDTLSQEQKTTKVKISCNTDHFWSSGISSRDGDEIVEMTDPSLNLFEVEEEFHEVKWSCRTPLPSGKLCPRRDRFKCPLHGQVVPRDSMGNPRNPGDKNIASGDDNKVEDWQDPELLRDIEAATGIDLKVSKNKGKGKKSGLTCLKHVQNTTRKRLEKKVFNKSAMKRVAADLTLSESKRFRK